MEQWRALIETLGWPTALLFAAALVLWRFGKALWKRLFDDDKGYVSKLVTEHIDMVRDVRSGLKEVIVACRETGTMLASTQSGIAGLSEAIGKDMTAYETVATNDALRHINREFRIVATKLGADISEPADEIDRILRRTLPPSR